MFEPLLVAGTIVSGNLAAGAPGNCAEDAGATPLVSRGFNLDSGSTCGFAATGDLQNANAGLGSLTDNGGPTPTHALLAGSTAIDAGGASCPGQPTDQRGVAWPQGGACDIGAFELEPAVPPPPPGDATTSPSNDFEIGKVKGKKLTLTVPGAGEVEVTDAADQSSAQASAAAKKLLKPSRATATGAGTVTVKLKLTKAAKRVLKRSAKVKVNAAITFTPTGGTANTETAKLKVKK